MSKPMKIMGISLIVAVMCLAVFLFVSWLMGSIKESHYSSISTDYANQHIDSWRSGAKEGDTMQVVVYNSDSDKSKEIEKPIMKGIKHWTNTSDSHTYAMGIDIQDKGNNLKDLKIKGLTHNQKKLPVIITMTYKDGHVQDNIKHIRSKNNTDIQSLIRD